MVLLLRDRHTQRLKNGTCTISTGLVFMEALTQLERAADHCSSIGVMLLALENADIMHNHHKYLYEVHQGMDASYRAESDRRRAQFLKPLEEIQ